jgi:polysaccharide biosynthesis protein PslH
MRVLLISPRLPSRGGKGDQLRAFQFARALAELHQIEVVSSRTGALPSRGEAELAQFATLHLQAVPRAERVLGALTAFLRGQPGQVGWMTPQRTWQLVRQRAADCDVVLAMTVRAVRGGLPVPLVLDHVDALSLNMRRRSAGPEPRIVRLAARIEATLLRRWERRMSRLATAQLAISPIDARALPPGVNVLPNSVDFPEPAAARERDIDVIFTGNMAYPPNADAVRWLSDAVAPALWRVRPEAAVWAVGRDARHLALDSRIRIASDVPDLAEYLGRAKVAIAPLRLATGSPNKVLEAMAAGAAVVATPAAVAPFAFPADAFVAAATAETLAAAVAGLLEHRVRRQQLVDRARGLVVGYGSEPQADRLMAILAAAVRHADGGASSAMGVGIASEQAGKGLRGAPELELALDQSPPRPRAVAARGRGLLKQPGQRPTKVLRAVGRDEEPRLALPDQLGNARET